MSNDMKAFLSQFGSQLLSGFIAALCTAVSIAIMAGGQIERLNAVYKDVQEMKQGGSVGFLAYSKGNDEHQKAQDDKLAQQNLEIARIMGLLESQNALLKEIVSQNNQWLAYIRGERGYTPAPSKP